MKNDTAQISSGQMKELTAAIIEGIPTDLPFEVAKNWIGKKTKLHKRMKELLFDEKVAKESDILQPTASVSVSGVPKFIAKESFRTDSQTVKFSYLGDNFKQFFLNKIEENIVSVPLVSYTLKKASLDAPILAELGDRAETTLAYLYELLSKQPNGESGALLTNGYANIFYIRGTDNNFWAVGAFWDGDGWSVRASSVEDPYCWNDGDRVFSRDS